MNPLALLPRLALGALTLCLSLAPAASLCAQPVVNVLNGSPASFQLGWNDLGPTNSYTVQTRESLGDAIWLNAPHLAPWPTPATQWTDPRTNPAAARFYRVLAVERAERGRLVAVTTLASYSREYVALLMAFGGIPITAQYGVTLYKLNYETVDPRGGRVVASGLLVLPQGLAAPLPLASYQHGTLARTNEAPTANLGGEAMVGVALATSGYATAVPDYLGLGDSAPLHPFHHAHSQATACVDLLRAARLYCASHSVTLSGKLFLAGYSQGGHVTMALHREIEAYHAGEFTITASAPMAGAYDLSGTTLNDFLSSRPKPNPYYYCYLVAAYQDVYHLAPTLADVFAPPYNTTLPPLLRGNATGAELNAAMPADPRQILKPEYLAALQSRPDHPFRVALRDNDLYAWRPVAPMRLFYCGGDQDVLPANSQVALDTMLSLGATNVTLTNTSPALNHGQCAQPSLLSAKAWFDTLK